MAAAPYRPGVGRRHADERPTGSVTAVLAVHLSPSEARAGLDGSEALARLCSTDALDLAMYGAALLGMVLREAADAGATEVVVEVEGAGEVHDAMAAAHGLALRREILQLRRALPIGEPWQLDVRPFHPGTGDEEAWLAVNNRAFAWHPDQAGWTLDDLHARMGEPWFDPAGFLLHERDGRLAGFCWTKVHDDERPPVGEIFVIGVDPDAQGHGLGRALVLAGLDHLAAAGLRTGMLWVEADNAPARALYADLGFEPASNRRFWGWTAGDRPEAQGPSATALA